MRDPYEILGRELAAAAKRQSAGAPARRQRWFSNRLHALSVTAALVLGGGAVALAATGVLSGSPVKPEVPLNAAAGNGLPVAGASAHLALLAADPGGGLPWGMRIEHTTRGQLCLQVGRVEGAQLGELGLDSAFGNDGRFHALPATVLPPGYGGSAGQVECVPDGQTVIFEDLNADRSAVRLLPSEFRGPPLKHPGEAPRGVPPVGDLRALAYGVLGPHAVSVTYKTPTGTRTIPVSRPDGGFLIVEPAGYLNSNDTIGGSTSGTAEPSSVDVGLADRPPAPQDDRRSNVPLWRPVVLAGRWRPGHQVLPDAQDQRASPPPHPAARPARAPDAAGTVTRRMQRRLSEVPVLQGPGRVHGPLRRELGRQRI